MIAVPRPQQARTRGQLVVHRTDSEQEILLQNTITTTTTTVEDPPTTNTTAEDLPTTTTTTEDPPTSATAEYRRDPSPTTATTFVTKIASTFRVKSSEKYRSKK